MAEIEKLQGKKILVTGATGLIGSAFVDMLLHANDLDVAVYAAGRNEGRAVKRFADYREDARFHFIKYDVTEPLDSDVCFDYQTYLLLTT